MDHLQESGVRHRRTLSLAGVRHRRTLPTGPPTVSLLQLIPDNSPRSGALPGGTLDDDDEVLEPPEMLDPHQVLAPLQTDPEELPVLTEDQKPPVTVSHQEVTGVVTENPRGSRNTMTLFLPHHR